jgi:outer membrane receptor protein involved in Fe transport
LNPPSGTATSARLFRNLGAYGNTTLYPFSKLGPAFGGLGLSAGGRYDAHNIYGNAWNGRAGLVYVVAERHFAKLLYGTSFRAPSSTQLFSNFILPGGVVGNQQLRPERARTLELALGASPIRYLTLRVDGYYTVISDRVEIRRPSETTALANPVPTNSTPITSKGFEGQLDFQAAALQAFLSYSFQRSDYPREDILAIDRGEARVQTDGYPTHLVKAGVTVTHRPWYLRAHVEGRYVGARLGSLDNNVLVHPLSFLTTRYRLPAYGLLDVALSSVGVELWQGHESVLLGKVSNLLDTRYQLPGYAGFDIPGFQRSYTLSLQQEL